jgi:hypothetical protein
MLKAANTPQPCDCRRQEQHSDTGPKGAQDPRADQLRGLPQPPHHRSFGCGAPSLSDRALTAASHNNLLTIRTTAGTLSERQMALRRGRAEFRLRSSTEAVVAEVRVTAEGLTDPVTARIEFAPVVP